MALCYELLDSTERNVLKTCSRNAPDFLPLHPAGLICFQWLPFYPLVHLLSLFFTWRRCSHASHMPVNSGYQDTFHTPILQLLHTSWDISWNTSHDSCTTLRTPLGTPLARFSHNSRMPLRTAIRTSLRTTLTQLSWHLSHSYWTALTCLLGHLWGHLSHTYWTSLTHLLGHLSWHLLEHLSHNCCMPLRTPLGTPSTCLSEDSGHLLHTSWDTFHIPIG